MRLWLTLLLALAVLLGVQPACAGDHGEGAPSATAALPVDHGCHDALEPAADTAPDPCPDACPGGEDCVNALAVYAVAAEAPASTPTFAAFARLDAPDPRDRGARPAFEPPPPKA